MRAGGEPGLAIQRWKGQIHFQDFPLEVYLSFKSDIHINIDKLNSVITTVSQDRRKRREIANNQFVQPHHVRKDFMYVTVMLTHCTDGDSIPHHLERG